MRAMRNPETGTIVNVHSHIITRNFWEYYVLDPKPNSRGIVFALVHGMETELGDVLLSEIKPHILSEGKDAVLQEIAPAPGWEWV